MQLTMRIGRFFSFGQGRVGQYLSPRVLVVRTPFRQVNAREFCCFGFDSFGQAQKFVQSLAYIGLQFKLRKSEILPAFPYEVVVRGQTGLARTLAFWDRRDHDQLNLASSGSRKLSKPQQDRLTSTPAIAA